MSSSKRYTARYDGAEIVLEATEDDMAVRETRLMLAGMNPAEMPDSVDVYRGPELLATVSAPLVYGGGYRPYAGGRTYGGPVRYVDTYGGNDVADHCPECGSRGIGRAADGSDRYSCRICGATFRLGADPPEGDPLYLVDSRHSYARLLGYDDVFDGLADAYDELDPVETEGAARAYFGPGYDTIRDLDLEDMDAQSASDRRSWEYEMYLAEADYLTGRQLPGLDVGGSYTFPDYPVKVTRVRQLKPRASNPGRRPGISGLFRRSRGV